MSRNTKLSVVGLGYVGLPLAIAFAKRVNVIGYDNNIQKIKSFTSGIDTTGEVGNDEMSRTHVEFSSDPTLLKTAKFHIVAVPTPVHADHTPSLSPLSEASKILGKNLVRGSLVVYESTVYPGVTEDVCVPILERESGLKCGVDFKVGYSPERINPGDKVHRLETIIKIVSGMDEDALENIDKVYGLVALAGTYKAPSIKVAEAAKVIENSQRDVNIAFMNEIAVIFHSMGINTWDVLEAARTKWNFLNFYPGLVGGHCIGVDPYYLTYKAELMGYHSRIIMAGRRINDDMSEYIAGVLVKMLIRNDVPVKGATVLLLGIAFKENCNDTRNSKAIDLYKKLTEYGIIPTVADPFVDSSEVWNKYGIKIHNISEARNMDAVVLVVAHDEFKFDGNEKIAEFYKKKRKKILMDIKGIYHKNTFNDDEWDYWCL